MKQTNSEKPLLVTTLHRGVFFGYGSKTREKIIELKRARMCVFWSAEIKGVLGLAASGPTANCKIGPEVEAILLQDVTAIIHISKVAEKAWEAASWNQE